MPTEADRLPGLPGTTRGSGRGRGVGARAYPIDRSHIKRIRRAVGQPRHRLAPGRSAPRHRRPARTPPLIFVAHNRRTVGRGRRPTQRHPAIPARRRQTSGRTRHTRRRRRLRRGRARAYPIDRSHIKRIRRAVGQPRHRLAPGRSAPRQPSTSSNSPAYTRSAQSTTRSTKPPTNSASPSHFLETPTDSRAYPAHPPASPTSTRPSRFPTPLTRPTSKVYDAPLVKPVTVRLRAEAPPDTVDQEDVELVPAEKSGGRGSMRRYS